MILTAAAIIIATLGALLLLRGIFQILKHPIKASFFSSLGACLSAFGIAMLAVSVNIASYQRLTYEQKVASISFYQLESQFYSATLHFPEENTSRQLDLRGDDWQLDAKVLKWHGYANVVGLDALYKLDRLSGRYQSSEQQVNSPITAYPLTVEPGINLWHYIKQYPHLLPFVDAFYGNAVFLPMSDKAQYDVFITQTGLIARPNNQPAEDAVKNWGS